MPRNDGKRACPADAMRRCRGCHRPTEDLGGECRECRKKRKHLVGSDLVKIDRDAPPWLKVIGKKLERELRRR